LHRGVDPAARTFWDAHPGGSSVLRFEVAQTVFASNEFLDDLVGGSATHDDNPFDDPSLDGFFPTL
jgi:hypothetical protein